MGSCEGCTFLLLFFYSSDFEKGFVPLRKGVFPIADDEAKALLGFVGGFDRWEEGWKNPVQTANPSSADRSCVQKYRSISLPQLERQRYHFFNCMASFF